MTAPSKRKHPRVETDFPAQVKPTARMMLEVRVVNLGQGGAFLVTNEIVPAGSLLVLTLNLDLKTGMRACLMQGKVAWANRDPKKGPVGWGVAFEPCSSTISKRIADYISSHLEASGTVTEIDTEPDKEKRGGTRGQLRG